MRSNSVPNLSEIEQSMAELLMICQVLAVSFLLFFQFQPTLTQRWIELKPNLGMTWYIHWRLMPLFSSSHISLRFKTSCGNASGSRQLRLFCTLIHRRPSWFWSEVDFLKLYHMGSQSTPASQITRQSVYERLRYWQLSEVFHWRLGTARIPAWVFSKDQSAPDMVNT